MAHHPGAPRPAGAGGAHNTAAGRPGYRRGNGHPLRLGEELGVGGEATIYAVAGDPALVAKIYHAPTAARSAKLQAMVANPPQDPMAGQDHISIAWPAERVYAAGGACAGFLMPRLDFKTNLPLLALYNPHDRLTRAPNFTWQYLLHTASNMARVLEVVHSQGYVVGDLNESNWLVNTRALVTLVDCDSMQVPGANGQMFRCLVGKPDYTPPELQGKDFSRVNRAPSADNFSLGVLIFLLLMEGVHPYMGVWLGAGNPPTLEENIAAGRCPYLDVPGVRPPPYGLPFNTLPPAVQELLRRCFGAGHADPAARPGPAEWKTTLAAVELDLVTCRSNSHHRYSRHLGTACPWCARMARLHGPDPFPLPGQAPPPRRRPLPPRPPAVDRPPAPRPAPPSYTSIWGAAAATPPRPPVQRRTTTGAGNWIGVAIFIVVMACTLINNSSRSRTPSYSNSGAFSSYKTATPRPTAPPAIRPILPRPPTELPAAPPVGEHLAYVSQREGFTALYLITPDGRAARRLIGPDDLRQAALAPGTQRVAYVSNQDGTPTIYTMDADGSNSTRITSTGAANYEPAWSPDGQQIAFVSERDGPPNIYVMAADGSGTTRLTRNSIADGQPAWSPDGKRIAFASERDGNWEIYSMGADGSHPTRLTTNDAVDGDPAWSPDGKQIAFTSQRDGNWEIYVMGADGSHPVQLTRDRDEDRAPVWAPDGRRLAFVSRRGAEREIYLINADGSDEQPLTNYGAVDGPVAWASAPPALAPADPRDRLAFVSDRDGGRVLYLLAADGRPAARLTTPDAAPVDAPAWSPDGRQIAFVSGEPPNRTVEVMNADGSGRHFLSSVPGDQDEPAWSPDGQQIAFVESFGTAQLILVAGADGSKAAPLTLDSGQNWSPAWSPDGKRIAFTSKRSGDFEIYVMNANGTTWTNLTDNAANDWNPAWSPDGRHIAFASDRSGDFEIYVMSADGGAPTRLTYSPGDDWQPAWSPDGRRIAFVSARDGKAAIYVMNADGSAPTRFTDPAANNWRPAWAPHAPSSPASPVPGAPAPPTPPGAPPADTRTPAAPPPTWHLLTPPARTPRR